MDKPHFEGVAAEWRDAMKWGFGLMGDADELGVLRPASQRLRWNDRQLRPGQD
jgi:hypothetical protein